MSEVKRWLASQIPPCSYNAPEYVEATEFDRLRAANERQRAESTRLREALRKYGVHTQNDRREPSCGYFYQQPCTCGLDAALAGEKQP